MIKAFNSVMYLWILKANRQFKLIVVEYSALLPTSFIYHMLFSTLEPSHNFRMRFGFEIIT